MTTKPSYTPALRFPDFLNDEEWEVKKLGEIAEIKTGYPFDSSSFSDDGEYLVVTNGNIQDYSEKVIDNVGNRINVTDNTILNQYLLNLDDILVTMDGTVGRCAKVRSEKLILAQRVARIIAKDIDKEFLYQILRSGNFSKRMIYLSHGGTIKHISLKEISDFYVCVPPLTEQRRIAACLSALDEMLAATNGKLEQLKAYKKGLMQQLFVDSMGGGKLLKINYLQIPKLRFPEFYEEKEWEEKKLGEVGYTYTGLSGKDKNDFGHGDAEYITYLNVFSNPIIKQEMNLPIEIDNKQHSVQYGDVFFTTSSETPDEVGMSSVWLENKDNVYLNSFCFGYRLTEEFDYRYLSYYFRSDSFRKRMVVLAQGISRYNISKIKAMELPIQYPTIPEQRKIASCLSSMDETINAYTEKATLLGQYKKGLMQRMFPKQ